MGCLMQEGRRWFLVSLEYGRYRIWPTEQCCGSVPDTHLIYCVSGTGYQPLLVD